MENAGVSCPEGSQIDIEVALHMPFALVFISARPRSPSLQASPLESPTGGFEAKHLLSHAPWAALRGIALDS